MEPPLFTADNFLPESSESYPYPCFNGAAVIHGG